MGLVYAGIDEAGYGPMLGPLVVSMAVFRLPDAPGAERGVDLWAMLDKTLGRKPSDAPGRIPIADSKKLKLPNSSVKRHPLMHLERGVLSMLGASGFAPETDSDLSELVGGGLEDRAWYEGPEVAIPLGNDRRMLRLDAAGLRADMRRMGIELLSLRARVVCESTFNALLRKYGSKAAVTQAAVASLLGEAVIRWGGGSDGSDESGASDASDASVTVTGPLRVAIDRQSGRTDYSELLRAACPGAGVELTHRCPSLSRYALTGEDLGDVSVRFEVEAENAHLPVALASMTAKLLRELAMARFNRYWCARVPELKPTAGYVTDARRWLAEVEGHATDAERAAMVRLA
ncbi:MAG: hypothetical protein AAF235_02740 [Planctomycetota bacterium]